MRRFVILLNSSLALLVMFMAYWAYNENYATQTAVAEERKIDRAISQLDENLRVQHAEWAFLNRPDNLRKLVAQNYAALGLAPRVPGQVAQARDLQLIPVPLSLDEVLAAGSEFGFGAAEGLPVEVVAAALALGPSRPLRNPRR